MGERAVMGWWLVNSGAVALAGPGLMGDVGQGLIFVGKP